MKTRMKQLISLLCVVTVSASTILSTNFLSAKAETTSGQIETLPTNMTEITFRDFGYADGEYKAYPAGKQYNGDTMDGTLFGGTVIFPEQKDVFIQYGGKEYSAGFNLGTAQDGDTQEWYLRLFDTKKVKGEATFPEQHFTSDVAGVQLVGTELKLNISMEYVEHDGDGEKNDVKLGIWFNGKLYDNKYIYLDDYANTAHSIGTWMSFAVSSKKIITIKSTEYTLPSDMTELTFEDFDVADGAYTNTISAKYPGTTLDNTLFSGKITFSETGETHFMFGGKSSSSGFILASAENDEDGHFLRLYDSNSDDAGKKFSDRAFYSDVAGTQLVGKEIELTYTIEYVNNDGGRTENDLKLGVWFNKKLYKNEYIYVNNYVDTSYSIGTTMTIWNRKSATFTLKSCNYQLPTDATNISFRDFGFEDGELTKWKGGQYNGTTMDNTLFGGTVTFPKTLDARLQYGGVGAWNGGFELVVAGEDATGYYLRFRDTQGAFEYMLDPLVAGAQLVGTEVKLHFSLEYVNNDEGNTKNDLKLGIWFNEKLYDDAYFYIDNYVDTQTSIGTWLTIIPKSKVVVKSSDITLPKDMHTITFRDFGFVDGDYTQYPSGQYEGQTLDNTLFSGKITFPESTSAHLMYGGKVVNGGFDLVPVQDTETGEWYLRLFDTKKVKGEATFEDQLFYSDVAGITLVGEELDLSLSLEYVDHDGDNAKDDVKLGVWFGGKLYSNNYIYLDDYVNTSHSMGTWMSFSISKKQIVTIKSVGGINWKPMPTGMKEITFRDFGFIDGDYTQYPTGQYEGETLDNTLFSGKITFPESASAHLMYGGKIENGGFDIVPVQDEETGEWYLRLFDTKKVKGGATFEDQLFYSDVAGVTLVGEELELSLSLEYVDHDGDSAKDDVKLGVWFGGKLYNNNYIYMDDYVNTGHSMGTWMSFSISKTQIVTIKSVGEINWKPMPTGMKEITFRDFGFIDGDYTKYPTGQYEGETLDNTLFSGKITFPESASAHLMYGGKIENGGFDIVPVQDEETGEWYLRLFDTKKVKGGATFADQLFYSDVAGVTLVGEELELSLSLEYVDHDGDNAKDDVKLGVWFGGKLYNNNYIYMDDYVNTGHSMGTWMSFSISKTQIVTIKSVGTIDWKELPTGMTEITFRDFGFIDGDYTKYPTGQYEGTTLDNTMFTGKITFPKSTSAHLMYGGKIENGGFDIVPAQDKETGEWYLRLFDTKRVKKETTFSDYLFYSDVAGVPLVGEEIALTLTLQYVDDDGDGVKNDVKLGVWFGGKLYNNRYIYLKDYANTAHSMGTWMSFSISKTTKINLKSVGEIQWKKLPEGFTEIGFSDFGIQAGVYEGSKGGSCELESMDKTLFSAIVTYSKEGETHLMYGGKSSYGGFSLVSVHNEKTDEYYLRLFDTNKGKIGKKFEDYLFYSNVAGVTLVGEELDLKISMEYVNHDDGKKNDDLKLGLWFGGKLYNNRYIYIDNYVNTAHSIGSRITIWAREGATFHVGRISEWLDWSIFGLSANWKKVLLDTDFNLEYTLAGGNPYTGDGMQIPYMTMAASLVAIVLCGVLIVKRRREDYGIQG